MFKHRQKGGKRLPQLTVRATIPPFVASLSAVAGQPAGPTATAVLAATIPPPTVALQASQAAQANVAATIPPPTCALAAANVVLATVAATIPPPSAALTVATVLQATVAATIPPPTATLSAVADQPSGTLDPNWAARIAQPGVVLAEDFSATDAVSKFMWHNGTLASHPEYAVRCTDPAIVAPGHTACLQLVVPANGGEPDTRSPTAWGTGASYVIDQCVTYTVTSGSTQETRKFTALQVHVSDAGNHPGNGTGGGDNAYWKDWGVGGTASSDTSVDWVRKLSASQEATPNSAHIYDAFGEGSHFWLHITYKPELYLTETRFSYNSGSGGRKILALRNWFQTFGSGQIVINMRSLWDHVQLFLVDSSSFQNLSDIAADPLAGSDFAIQPSVRRLSAADHPAGIDPTTGTSAERTLKAYGGARSWCDPSQSYGVGRTNNPGLISPGNPMGSDQRSGGIMGRRDMGGKWTGLQLEVRVGTLGQFDSYIALWCAREGHDYELLGEVLGCRLYGLVPSGSPGTINDAYGAPGTLSGPAIGYNGAWLLAQETGRIKNSGVHPSGIQRDSWVAYGEYVIRVGDIGFAAPGFINGPVSRTAPAGNSSPVIAAVIPAPTVDMTATTGSGATLAATIPAPTVALQAQATQPAGSGDTLAELPATPLQGVRLSTVTNGRPTLLDAIDPAWVASSGATEQGDASATGRDIFQYSGGYWDFEAGILYWNGGGHSASWNNGIYALVIAGGAHIPGWFKIDCSNLYDAVGLVPSALQPLYRDGKWASVHSYCGFAKVGNRLFRYGGALQPSGGQLANLLSVEFGSLTYTAHGNGPASSPLANQQSFYTDGLAWDPAFPDRLLVYCPGPGEAAIFNPTSLTWHRGRSAGVNLWPVQGSGGATASQIYDNRRHRLITLGAITSSGGRAQHYLQFDGEFATRNELAAAGSTALDTRIHSVRQVAVCDDADRDCLWAAELGVSLPPAAIPADRGTRVWKGDWQDSGTLHWQAFPLTGEVVNNTRSGVQATDCPVGGWGKIGCVRGHDALFILDRLNTPVLMYRKPA